MIGLIKVISKDCRSFRTESRKYFAPLVAGVHTIATYFICQEEVSSQECLEHSSSDGALYETQGLDRPYSVYMAHEKAHRPTKAPKVQCLYPIVMVLHDFYMVAISIAMLFLPAPRDSFSSCEKM